MKHKYQRGQVMEVVNSPYSGVHPGERGSIECLVKQGYGLKISKVWPQIISNQRATMQSRTMFFEEKDIKPAK